MVEETPVVDSKLVEHTPIFQEVEDEIAEVEEVNTDDVVEEVKDQDTY